MLGAPTKNPPFGGFFPDHSDILSAASLALVNHP